MLVFSKRRITSSPKVANLLKPKPPIWLLIKNLIKENIGFEGAQALIRIFDTKNVFLKIFWVVCLLGSNMRLFAFADFIYIFKLSGLYYNDYRA